MTLLVPVEPQRVGEAWPLVRKHLAEMAERSRGKILAEDIAQLSYEGRMQLWIVVDDSQSLLATGVTEMTEYPRAKVAKIVGMVGEHADRWVHHMADFENWARAQGCSSIMNIARKGWARKLPDYDLTHVVLERKL